jgi:hypothetical protein
MHFFETLQDKCDGALVVDHSGQVLRKHGDHKSLGAIVPKLLADAAQWLSHSSDPHSRRQLLMFRGQNGTDSCLCLAIDKETVTVLHLPASLTGRVFGAAAAAEF